MSQANIIVKTWGEFTPDDVFEMAVLRSEVFFVEQRIDEEEFDSFDRNPETMHLWCSDALGMQAYLRIIHNDHEAASHHGIAVGLGRMVVRADSRGLGLAQKLMDTALEIAGDSPLYLHAQEYVKGLYAKSGFVETGEQFMEAGIEHRLMLRYPGV